MTCRIVSTVYAFSVTQIVSSFSPKRYHNVQYKSPVRIFYRWVFLGSPLKGCLLNRINIVIVINRVLANSFDPWATLSTYNISHFRLLKSKVISSIIIMTCLLWGGLTKLLLYIINLITLPLIRKLDLLTSRLSIDLTCIFQCILFQ